MVRSGKDAEDRDTAFRLLTEVDHRDLVYVMREDTDLQKLISHERHICLSIQPRHRLQQLQTMFDEDPNMVGYLYRLPSQTFSRSLWICQLKDDEKAALDGVPLTLDTNVEDGFTHGESIWLHLDMIYLIITADNCKELIDDIWETMLGEKSISIPGAKAITLSWFSGNPEIMDRDLLAEKLRSAGDNVKELPEYNDACDEYM